MGNNNYPQGGTTTANVELLTLANMVDILEQERKRIAYDIHDRVQHSLRLIRDTAPTQIKKDIDKVIDDLREVCYRLTPKSLDELSLIDYLPIYIITLQRSCKFYIDYRGNATSNLPSKVETELFGIINEVITNIMKYAAQTPIVFVRFWEDEDKFVISIQDLGKGFDISQTTNTIGLKSMRGRAEIIYATFDIQSTIGEGTKIKVSLPKANVPAIDTTPSANVTTQQTPNIAPAQMGDEISKQQQINDNLIYIIDNQEEVGRGLELIIKEKFSNFQIVVFTNPDDATTALCVLKERNEPQPAIIISDITMPNKSGFVFVKEAQAISPSSKYIIYTVNDLPIYIVKAVKELKVNAFICKEEEWDSEEHPMVTAIKRVYTENYFSPKANDTINKISSLSVSTKHKGDSAKRYLFTICYKNKANDINGDFIKKSYDEIKSSIINEDKETICKEKLGETSIYQQIQLVCDLEKIDASDIIDFLNNNFKRLPYPLKNYIAKEYFTTDIDSAINKSLANIHKKKVYNGETQPDINASTNKQKLKDEVIEKTQKITKETIKRYFDDYYDKYVNLSSVEKEILQEIPEIDTKR